MAFWVSRIVLKSGELLIERELRPDENRFDGTAPPVGSRLTVQCQGQTFDAEVIAGKQLDRKQECDPPELWLRVAEVYRDALGHEVLANMEPGAGYRALQRSRATDQSEREASGLFLHMAARKLSDG